MFFGFNLMCSGCCLMPLHGIKYQELKINFRISRVVLEKLLTAPTVFFFFISEKALPRPYLDPNSKTFIHTLIHSFTHKLLPCVNHWTREINLGFSFRRGQSLWERQMNKFINCWSGKGYYKDMNKMLWEPRERSNWLCSEEPGSGNRASKAFLCDCACAYLSGHCRDGQGKGIGQGVEVHWEVQCTFLGNN